MLVSLTLMQHPRPPIVVTRVRPAVRPSLDFRPTAVPRRAFRWFPWYLALIVGCRSGASAMDEAVGSPSPSGSATAAREQTADEQIHHVLHRLAFGPRSEDARRVREMGVDAWIAEQLSPASVSDSVWQGLVTQYPLLTATSSELMAAYPPMERRYPFLGELSSSRVARAVLSPRQLEEVLVDFWHNHFNVFAGKDRTRYFLVPYDTRVIRPHAMGRFRDLLGAVAKSEAMLYYLDNWQSVADSGRPVLGPRGRGVAGVGSPVAAPRPGARRRGLNENYARELMELHTLGVDGGYSQQDVIDVARAFTGWTLARGAQGGGFAFRPAVHDAGAKSILGRQFPAGRGQTEGEAVLDLLARHPKTAQFIAAKLVRRFVSDTPPPALVARAARTFSQTDGDIRETVRTIVTSPEFFARAAFRAKVKSPFELVVSTLRILDARPDGSPRTAQLVSQLGQPLFGHQAPNGYPETGDAWMNTGAILNRINFGLTVAAGRVPGVRLATWPAGQLLAQRSRDVQIEGVIHELLGGWVSPDTRDVLRTGTNPFLQRHASDSLPAATAPGGLAQIVGLALGSPEFQRR